MAGRRTSTQEMMAQLEVIEEEDAITRSSVEGVHNKTSASAKATLAKIDKTLQEMQLEIAASRVGQDALDVKMAETPEREKDLMVQSIEQFQQTQVVKMMLDDDVQLAMKEAILEQKEALMQEAVTSEPEGAAAILEWNRACTAICERLTREFGQWQSLDAGAYALEIIDQMDTSCELRSEQAVAEAVKICSDEHDDAVGQIAATVQSLADDVSALEEKFQDDDMSSHDSVISMYDQQEQKLVQEMHENNARIGGTLNAIRKQKKLKALLERQDDEFSNLELVGYVKDSAESVTFDDSATDADGDRIKLTGVTEDNIGDKLNKAKERLNRLHLTLRDQVIACFKETKGGNAHKDTPLTKEDLSALKELKLGSKEKSSRKKSKGKKLCMILKDAVLKSPQDYAGTAAVIAFWIQCNVSLTSMEMITVERAVELKEGKLWADDKQGNNKWGLYKEQISLVGNEAKRLYNATNGAIPSVVLTSTRPDFNFDLHHRGKRVKLRGCAPDGFTYWEMWRVQQEFMSTTEMDEARMKVFRIRPLFYQWPLEKAIPAAQAILDEAQELEARVSFQLTGRIWVESIAALHKDIKADLLEIPLTKCPDDVDEQDCIAWLSPLLAEIQSIAQRNAKLETKPADLPDSHELHYTYDRVSQPTGDQTGGGGAGNGGDGGNRPPIAGASCCVQGCGRKLSNYDLTMHQGRKKRAAAMKPMPVVKAICSKHYKEAQMPGHKLRWYGAGPVTKESLVATKKVLKKLEELEGQPSDQPTEIKKTEEAKNDEKVEKDDQDDEKEAGKPVEQPKADNRDQLSQIDKLVQCVQHLNGVVEQQVAKSEQQSEIIAEIKAMQGRDQSRAEQSYEQGRLAALREQTAAAEAAAQDSAAQRRIGDRPSFVFKK